MLIDLPRFVAAERPSWAELEQMLDGLENRAAGGGMSVEEARRFHFLYQKVSADLARINTFASEPALRRYLESLTARAYAEVHETREKGRRFALGTWFFRGFPAAFRRNIRAFLLATAVMMAGAIFGGFAVTFDSEAKEAIMPQMFASHLGDPAERVRREESGEEEGPSGSAKAAFSAHLMRNNITVSLNALALGATWGVGTIVVLFYNGVVLGLVALDYILAGQTIFLLGWLLPHGSIEIPAILIGGQSGLVLATALIGWGTRVPLRDRLRRIGPDLGLLCLGFGGLLVWAGLVEAFLSQYHAPVIPYSLKIAFGIAELLVLAAFLNSGRSRPEN